MSSDPVIRLLGKFEFSESEKLQNEFRWICDYFKHRLLERQQIAFCACYEGGNDFAETSKDPINNFLDGAQIYVLFY
jgi:hypothetical protein